MPPAASGAWRTIEFADDRWPALTMVDGHAVVSTVDGVLARVPGKSEQAIVGIGDNRVRLSLTRQLLAQGFMLATVVHPSAVISALATLGSGTLVCAGALVNPGAQTGLGVIVNTGAIVEHDCHIGDGSHVCPGVRMAGGVRVGSLCWIGIGATILQGRAIGDNSTLGAGAVVLSDVLPMTTVVGCPAKEIRP